MKSKAQLEADRKYKQAHRDDINRRMRERYARRKKGKIKLPHRPVMGANRCSVCRKVLYHYEIKLGKCLKCARESIDTARTTPPSQLAVTGD
jgi:hypothetical protein